jgi:hypothetical protein
MCRCGCRGRWFLHHDQDFLSAHAFIYDHFHPSDINLQPCLSGDPVGRFQNLAPGDLRPTRRIAGAAGLPLALCCPRKVTVTMPSGAAPGRIKNTGRSDVSSVTPLTFGGVS